jgi:hypothetical protein
MTGEQNTLPWQQLLHEALTAPGSLTGVYDRFHDYSLTNMLLFRMQGIHEPVASYSRWQSLGRHVLKGSRAKEVIVPVLVKGEPDPNETLVLQRQLCAYGGTAGSSCDVSGWRMATMWSHRPRLTQSL